jgi:hypothetical protein
MEIAPTPSSRLTYIQFRASEIYTVLGRPMLPTSAAVEWPPAFIGGYLNFSAFHKPPPPHIFNYFQTLLDQTALGSQFVARGFTVCMHEPRTLMDD